MDIEATLETPGGSPISTKIKNCSKSYYISPAIVGAGGGIAIALPAEYLDAKYPGGSHVFNGRQSVSTHIFKFEELIGKRIIYAGSLVGYPDGCGKMYFLENPRGRSGRKSKGLIL